MVKPAASQGRSCICGPSARFCHDPAWSSRRTWSERAELRSRREVSAAGPPPWRCDRRGARRPGMGRRARASARATLEDELHGQLNEAGACDRWEESGGGGAERRVRRQTGSSGDSANSGGGGAEEVGGVGADDVGMVEEVEGLGDELQPCLFGEADVAGEAGVERDLFREIERVAAEAGKSVGSAVAVVVQVEAEQAGIGVPGLGGENTAQFPATENRAADAVQAPGVVQVPDSAQDEAVPLVVDSGGAIGARVERIGDLLGVVEAEGHDGGLVGHVVNDLAEGV